MSTDLVTQAQTAPPELRIANTVATLKANVQLVQHVMRDLMVEGTHYGKIPGTGDKPTLLQPGAETICLAFHWAARYAVEDLSIPDVVRYRITCELWSRDSGEFVGSGQGEASSDEEKYRWRRAVCDDEWEATAEDRRRVKWGKGKGGSTYTTKQVRSEPADIANTVLKMGSKRALIAATRTASGCSDMFAQDLEDLPAAVREAVTGQPQEKAPPQPLGEDGWETLVSQAEGFGYAASDVLASAAAVGYEGAGAMMPRDIAKRLFRSMRDNPAKTEPEPSDDGPSTAPQEPAPGPAVEEGEHTDASAETAPESPEEPNELDIALGNVTPLNPDAAATPQQLAELKRLRKAAGINAAEFNSLVSEYGGEPTADGFGLTVKTAGYVVSALKERGAGQ